MSIARGKRGYRGDVASKQVLATITIKLAALPEPFLNNLRKAANDE